MTEDNFEYDIYQVLATRKDDPEQKEVFSKIFKLPKNTIDWLIDLACYGIIFRDGYIDPNTHIVHKAIWDPEKNIWVGLKLDKT